MLNMRVIDALFGAAESGMWQALRERQQWVRFDPFDKRSVYDRYLRRAASPFRRFLNAGQLGRSSAWRWR